MPGKNIYETIKQVIQDVVAPELREINGELKLLHTEIRRLDEKIDSFREEFRSEIKRLDQKIDGVEREVKVTRDEFKIAIEIHERLSALEAKIGGH